MVGAALMPTLARLADCADIETATTAKSVVLALYGARGSFVTRAGLGNLTSEELNTALDVLSSRNVPDIGAYLRRYFGPGPNNPTHAPARRVLQLVQPEPPAVGLDCFAQVRDAEMHSTHGIMAARILKLDLLGRLSATAHTHLSMLSRDAVRGLLAEFAEHELPEAVLIRLIEAVCS